MSDWQNDNADGSQWNGNQDNNGGGSRQPNGTGDSGSGWNAPAKRDPRPQVEDEALFAEDGSRKFPPAQRWAGWRSSGRRYEYKEEALEDGVPPRDQELETELFGDENHVQTGIHFEAYKDIEARVYGSGQDVQPMRSFDQANLHPIMRQNVTLARYNVPTPVQSYSIPLIQTGNDMIASAQTGSGKTAAFLIPMINAIIDSGELTSAGDEEEPLPVHPLIAIICPTRELAGQIFDEARRFTYRTRVRPAAVYGGANTVDQKIQLRKGANLVVATPGRLKDFIEKQFIKFDKVKFLVLDEGDRMLDMGFEGDLRTIIETSEMPSNDKRQTAMFSATWPQPLRVLARKYLRSPFPFVKIGRVGGTTHNITQKIVQCEGKEKKRTVLKMLRESPPTRTLIFCKTKRAADELDSYLYENNLPSTSVHGDRDQREREDALTAFRTGNAPILVATEVAARGLDIANVMHVINYDLPEKIDDYIHRIGRCGRIGNLGMATSFYTDRDTSIGMDLVRVLVDSRQEVPDFLQEYVTDDLRWQDDEPEKDDEYAAQEAAQQPMDYADEGGDGGYGGEAGGNKDGNGQNGDTMDTSGDAADQVQDGATGAPAGDDWGNGGGDGGGDGDGGW